MTSHHRLPALGSGWERWRKIHSFAFSICPRILPSNQGTIARETQSLISQLPEVRAPVLTKSKLTSNALV